MDVGVILMGLFGGLAIFLFGMEQMTDALKSMAGSGMSTLLGKLTKNRFTAAFTGAFVTAVIQSSSVTSVLVVGFISAGLMSLQQSVGIIMGANIGTTITAQIIAFKITQYALMIIAVGFGFMFLSKRQNWRRYGTMIMGLGMIFLGMGFMSDATDPLRTYQPFIDAMQRMSHPVLGILAAALFTALVQSSSATTGIVIVLASQGFITLEAGIAMAFGANIGSCVTAILAALGKPREASQAAAVHLLFNVLGVVIWLPFIGFLANVVYSISPAHPELEGAARLAAETPRQIANAHTLFNVANTCIFIWFTGPITRLVTRYLPHQPEVIPEKARPQYLQDVYMETPALAMDRIQLETSRLGRHVVELGSEIAPAVVSGTTEDLDRIIKFSQENQTLYDAINEYIRQLSTQELSAAETRRLAMLTAVASYVQNVGETNAIHFTAIGRERLAHGVNFGGETLDRVGVLGKMVRETFDQAMAAFTEPELARTVIDMKPEIQKCVGEILEYLAERLKADDPHRALLYRLENQMVEVIQRSYYFAKKIAKEIVKEDKASSEDSVSAAEMADSMTSEDGE